MELFFILLFEGTHRTMHEFTCPIETLSDLSLVFIFVFRYMKSYLGCSGL